MTKIIYSAKTKVSDVIPGNSFVDAMSKIIEDMTEVNPDNRLDIFQVKEKLNKIFYEHALYLKEPPFFKMPSHLKESAEIERWRSKITFAQELHKKCMNTIFSTVFQDQKLPQLRKDVEKIVFTCSGCGKKLHVYRHMDRKKGNCPQCGKRILILLEDKPK